MRIAVKQNMWGPATGGRTRLGFGFLIVALLTAAGLGVGQASAAKGVAINESGGGTNVTEGGATDTYTVVLTQSPQPAHTVTVTITTDGRTTVNPASVSFTSGNWWSQQTITVTAVNDFVAEGNHSSTISHTVTSDDAGYNGVGVSDVVALITDNDVAAVNITQSGGSTDVDERGPSSDTYTVALNSQPTANVTITISPDAQTTVSPSSLTFTAANWNVAQPVTVTAVTDGAPEGNHNSTIAHAAASADGFYSGIAIGAVTAHVTDLPGILVTESGGSTDVNEQGPTSDTYAMVLTRAPTANVIITVTPEGEINLGVGAGVAQSLTFTPANWNTPQTLTVTAVNDALPEGPHTSLLRHMVASSDSDYNGYSLSDVTVHIIDNDVAGVTIAETGLSTDVAEGGVTDTYSVVLTAPPTADVTVTLTTDGQTTVAPASLTFTTGNWNVAQPVTVTAVDDALVEGPHLSTIRHTLSSTDPAYNGFGVRDVTAHVTDNDAAGTGGGVTVAQTDSSTDVSEQGPTSDTYTLVLDSVPTDDVIITVTPDAHVNLGAGAGVAITKTFTPANWNVAQTVTVTAVNDSVAEGPHTSIITHTAASTDADFSGITIAGVTVHITDNDVAGVTIAETGSSTDVNEQGATTDTYTVVLNTAPTADVTITLIADGQITVNPATLVFNAGNWNVAQTVTVTAVNDALPEGPHISIIQHTAASDDAHYNGFAVPDVTVHVTDNDVAGVTLAESGGSTAVTEGGATDTYTVVLTAPPTADVTVTLTTDGQTTAAPATLTFTTGNWNATQTVTVTAVNDSVAQGSRTSMVHHNLASVDPHYNGLAVRDVVATVTDNDVAGVTITEPGGSTDIVEGGATDTYTVVLASRPTTSVTVTISPDSQSTVSIGTLTFTTGNWNVAQTVTVTAVDDALPEGPHTSTIAHRVSSTDVHYSGIAARSVTAHITDDDVAGVTIAESGGSTDVNEQGPTSDTYTVVLTAPPTAAVTITVTPDAQTTVSPAALTFTTANWNAPQTVTVTAVDDTLPEGPHTSMIRHSVASTDTNYNGFAALPVVARVTDNDLAGVTISESGGSTDVNEQGATSDTYTVVLNTRPTATVTIAVAADGKTAVNPATLTFTAANWSTPQSVTVSAVDDALAEGVHSSAITHTAASTDSNYNNVSIRAVTAHVTDNDGIGVTIAETGGSTAAAEQGPTSDTYTVVLNTCPAADVTITVTPDAQTTVAPGTLTFTAANWNVPQTVTVTAVDDLVPEGLHTSTIAHSAASADPDYSGLAIRDVTVTVTDNDMVGVTVVESGGLTAVSEAGPTSDTYAVVLNTPPAADVTITVATDGQTAAAPGTLTFTPADWNVPQTVTVTAVDDTLAEGQHSSTITHTAASVDANYNNLVIRTVTARITDNDVPAVIVSESGSSTDVNEQGPTTDSYTVVLSTCPTADVTVTVTPDAQVDLGAGAGVARTLTFTPVNWNAAQTVNVTAVDDSVAEGAHSSTLTHGAASTDPNYSGIAIPSVVVHITDNDAVGVTITELDGSTDVNEQGPTSDTYTVVLNTRPTADVTITVAPDAQITVAPGTLTFTPANWNAPQTVTVTAVDDLLAEGAHAGTITHYAASTDSGYSGISIRGVTAHVTDNDIAGVVIAETGGNTQVSEDGPTSDTYTVVLTTPPNSANVVITVAPDRQTDLGAGAAAPITLTFTPANWNVPQVVTVTAVDDAVAEGPHSSTITHTAASTDPSYNGIVVRSVTAAVTDNDCAGIVIDESDGSTVVNEAGPTSDTYTVVLSIAPTSPVTITVDPDMQTDVGAGTGTPVNLTFTPANWNAPQTVTLTAVDDAAAEGLHTSTITHTAVSADGNYNGISIRNVVASVIDNDFAGVLITQTGATTEVSEEGPTSDTYTAQLTLPPTANVTITVTPDAQTTVNPSTLTFTPANWNVPQTVTVTAVDDPVAEGAHHTSTITHTAASSDPNYNGITIAGVTAAVTDNDMSGVTITESGGKTEVSEKGPTSDTYTVVLTTTPTANVRIVVAPDAQTSVGAGAAGPITLNFTAANWNVPQTVTVTAIADGLAEGLHQSNIIHTAFSSDSNYNGIAIKTVVATVIDADTAGLTLGESGNSTEVNEEGPTSDSYTIVLNTRPQSDVVVNADPDVYTNLGEGPGVPVSLTFTPDNWNRPQTVTVTATDDTIAQGLHNSVITHVVSSTDRSYNGLTRVLTVLVYDNDVPGVTVAESGASTDVSEQGPTSDSYTLQLNTPPRGDVIVTVDPDEQTDVGAGPDNPITLTFTPANWSVPKTVTVTAVDDLFAEGAHTGTITHQASSTDSTYNKITIRNVTVHLTDNDVAGVTLLESEGSTAVKEDGPTSDNYTLVLHTPPKADVTIVIVPDTQTTVSPATVTFNSTNWNIPRTIAVTAVDDTLAEGAHTSTISHLAISADPAYNGINIRSVSATVGDNDFRGVAVVESGGDTTVDEIGRTVDSYDIVLTTPVTADVVITADPQADLDLGAGPGQSITLTFTPADWNIRQTVAVHGTADGASAGPHTATIKHSIFSRDGSYARLEVDSVIVNVIDNDVNSYPCAVPIIFIMGGWSALMSLLGWTRPNHPAR